jgi:hypothetical protein
VANGQSFVMAFNGATVERAVKEFYASGAAAHGQAHGGAASPGGAGAPGHEWLNRAQESPEAWLFVWDLLEADKSAEVQFFGANALALKVSRGFHEVSEADFPLLQDKLMRLYRRCATDNTPRVVLVRLAVAVTALMIRGCAAGLWLDPVGDQINLLRRDCEERGLSALAPGLELLTVLPEEFATQVLPTSRRSRVRANMADNLPQVLQLIVQVLQEASMPAELQRQAVRSLQGWVQFGLPDEASEKVVNLLLPKVAGDPHSMETYVDVLASVVSHPDTHSHPNTMRRVISQMVGALGGVLERLLADEAFESATPLASLFITIGETHSRLLIDWTTASDDGRAQATRLVSLILQVSSCPAQYPTQERLSEMPFGFWYVSTIVTISYSSVIADA